MQISYNNYSVAEIKDMMDRRDLVVNPSYQRGPDLWPAGARSYFIDTILENFPFPKLYFYEFVDREHRRPRRELVDGQQRVKTILSFINDEFAITGESAYKGQRFSDLSDEKQDEFLSYSVAVDVVRNATRGQILQMFRRMNAYTLPLNRAEQRHATFYGDFKWFINDITDEYAEFFSNFDILTERQIVRMQDAELVTEVILTLDEGIVSSSPTMLKNLYRKYDEIFPKGNQYRVEVRAAFDFIIQNLSELSSTFLMKTYVVHMLVAALIHNRFGNEMLGGQTGLHSAEVFSRDVGRTKERLYALAEAHEQKDEEGPFARYVWSCLGGTNRAPRREARFRALFEALNL